MSNIIRPEDLGAFVDGTIKKFRGGIFKAFVRAAWLSRSWIITRRIPSFKYPPIHTGRYKAGWEVDILPTTTNPTKVILFNAVPYATEIEKGFPPHRVAPAGFYRDGTARPTRGLVRWAYLKLANHNMAKAWALATAVARKHWERGRKGLKVMTGPVSTTTIKRITDEELRRELKHV